MSYRARNNRVIKRALVNLQKEKDVFIKNSFVNLMRVGMENVLYAHNDHHQAIHHTQETNTIGFAVFHNGKCLALEYQNRGGFEGRVDEKLYTLGRGTTGWVGFIASEMEYNWYRVDWEIGFLKYSARQIKADFHKIFSPYVTYE